LTTLCQWHRVQGEYFQREREEDTMRKFMAALILCILLLAGSNAFAEIKEREHLYLSGSTVEKESDLAHKENITSFCIEGHVFVRSVGGITTNAGTGVGVALVQVYEEKGGKVVPMRCEGR
jgi:uncharacterized lipoprotein NlpE involved in copper resistance